MFKRMAKRITTLLLAFMLIVSMSAIPIFAATQTFSDVPTSAWYYSVVENLAGKGIINGYPDGTFRPSNNVERQHVAVMVMKGAGIKNSGKKADFTDVSSTNQFSTFIATLAEKGIINGFPDGTFRPKDNVTRGQAAIMISKAFGLTSAMHIEDFKDTVGHYASKQILTLNSHGIINGYSDGTFRPNASVTRAEISKMISFAMNVANGSTKYQPDPVVQEAENAVRIAERDPRLSNYSAAQELIDALPDGKSKQQLQARLDVIQGENHRIFNEAEPNNYIYNANTVDLNFDGSRSYSLLGNISGTRSDKDYYHLKMPKGGKIGLLAYWAEEDFYRLGWEDDLEMTLFDARGKIITMSEYVYDEDEIGIHFFQEIYVDIPAGDYYIEIMSTSWDDIYVGAHYAIIAEFYPN